MKKQPKLLLRESCVHDVSKDWPAGRFVEMGAGTGHMTRIFLQRGFSGACHDLGDDSRRMMRANLAFAGDHIQVVDALTALPASGFDYLFAFEVLEHIDDDLDVLREWVSYLRPGGRILVSVPAHMRKYGRSDEIVGHVRRYEREGLRELLAQAGIRDIKIVNYGFPATEITRRLSNRMIRDDSSYDQLNPQQRSIRSAQAKPGIINRTLALIPGAIVSPLCVIQRWFYRFDLGDGYVAWGVKGGG
ncbi:MAG: methyltransferase domain-containing protein [Gammaproteobacteria bacterium]